MAQRAFTSHPLVVRRVTVRRIEEITPRMRRIVVGGEGLGETVVDGHTHRAFAAPGFDDHIKLIFAADGDLESALPIQLPHGIEWTAAENRVARDYTPRWVDAAAGEMALDFVLHGEGPAASWAQSAAPGDELCFVGPKSSLRLPDGLDWIALIADETGLPAVGRFLDERPVDAPVHVLLLVEDAAAQQALKLREGDTVAWVTASGADAAAVEEAVRALALPEDGEGYVWAAAESRALLPVRRYLQRERGFAKDRVNVTGYWHAETAHGDDASVPELPPVAEPASPVPWLVVRAAVRLGLVDALADGPLPLAELAARLGVAARSLEALRGILTSAEVIVGDVDALALGRFGEDLLEDHHREEFDGLEAEAVLALRDLDQALRDGVSPWERAHAATLATQAQDDAAHVEELMEDADRLAYLLDGFVANPMWDDVSSLLVVGPGAPAVLGAFDDGGRAGINIALHEHGRVRDAVVEAAGRDSAAAWKGRPVDVAVLALALAHRTDAEAVALLDQLGPHASRLILLESSRPDALSPGAEEHQIVGFAMTGAPFRSSEALGDLAAAAGWSREQVLPLGWGIEATFLVRA